MEQTTKTTVTVKKARVGSVEAALAKFNKRAERLGCKPVEWAVSEPRLYENTFAVPAPGVPGGVQSATVRMIVVDVTITGEAVKFAGWTFRARKERVKGADGECIVSGPDAERFGFHRTRAIACEHCQQNRKRNVSFIVEHDNGEQKEVGSTCVADFLGTEALQAVARFDFWRDVVDMLEGDRFDADLDEWRAGRLPVEYFFDLRAVVELTMAAIRRDGWVSSATAKFGRELATWREVLSAVADTSGTAREKITDEDRAWADKVLAHFEAVREEVARDVAAAGDFDHRVYLLAKLGVVEATEQWVATAVGAVYGAKCKIEAAARKADHAARLEEFGEPGFFGEVGKRGVFTLDVQAKSDFEGLYGTMYIVRGKRSDSNDPWIWKTNSDGVIRFNGGDERCVVFTPGRYTVKATVKEQTEHPRFGKQTVLSRLAVVKFEG